MHDGGVPNMSPVTIIFLFGGSWFPGTPSKAPVPDPNLWTHPIVCVSTHIERQEADVNTQEFVIPFLVASRPPWENNTVREDTV